MGMGVGMMWLSVGAGVGVRMGEELARAWACVWQVWLDEGMGVSMVWLGVGVGVGEG